MFHDSAYAADVASEQGKPIERTSARTRRLLAPNPGPMTLDGTNSYLIGTDRVVVVDPGPDDPAHLRALASAGQVELILITHHHPDHVDGVAALARTTGAPVRAIDPAFCVDAPPLADGETIEAGGAGIRVLATPGHTTDSACFVVADDSIASDPTGEPVLTGESVLTGDTILGRGSTIIADPDGALGPYLSSLRSLRELGAVRVLPGHGPSLPDLAAICDAYLAHREARLDQVRAALARLGEDASVAAVTDAVYDTVEPNLRFAAEASMRAQLVYLRGRTPN